MATNQEQYWQFEVFGQNPEEIGFFGTAGVKIPAGTTAERPSTPTEGHIRLNTDTVRFEGFFGGLWQDIGTGGGGGGTFIGLTDTPGVYTGLGSRILRVGSGETDVEFSPIEVLPSGAIDVSNVTNYETLVTGDDIVPNRKYVQDQDALRLALTGGSMTGNIVMTAASTITGLPAVPVSATEAVSKAFVDSISAGLDPKESVRLATTSDLDTETGDTWTPAGSGVGKTITSDAATATLDGIAVVDGDRILVKDESGGLGVTHNGIYTVSGVGVLVTLTRATDQDGSPANEVSGGNFTFVEDGSTQAGTGWVVVFDGTIVVDTNPIPWTQFTGAGGGAFLPLAGGTMTGSILLGAPGIQYIGDIAVPTAPAFTFAGDLGTGMHQISGAGAIDFLAGTALNWTMLPAPGALLPGTTLAQDIGTAGLKIKDIYADHGLFNFGAAGDPSYSFEGDTNTGMFNGGGDILNFATAGLLRFTIEADGTLSVPAGTYEALVTADDDIPNKKYVDDTIAAVPTYVTVGGDSGTATAATQGETINLIGETSGGITTTAGDAPDQVAFGVTPIDLATGGATLALGDFVIVSDSADAATTLALKYTFTDIVEDLDIPNAIASNGFVVRTAADTYTSRTITVAGVGASDGLDISDGAGTAGDPVIGLDIDGSPPAGEDVAAADLFLLYNDSATANETFTLAQVAAGVTSSGITGLIDDDSDTQIQVEEGADDDTIRFDVGDTPVGYSAVTDVITVAASGIAMALGTADATTAGADITLTAGAGGGTSGKGGNVNINAGDSSGATPGPAADDGGSIILTAGDNTGAANGGSVVLIGGGPPASAGTPGDIVLIGGPINDSAVQGRVVIFNEGSSTRPSLVFGEGAGVPSDTGFYTNAGAIGGTADEINIGINGSSNVELSETLFGFTPSGDAGSFLFTAGDGVAGATVGGTFDVTGGKGGATAAGGAITLTGGDGGSTSGDGGDINLNGGDADGSGAGGTINMIAGAGASPGGDINLTAGASTSTDVGGTINLTAGAGGTGAGGDGGAVVITAGSAGAASAGDGGDIELRPGALDGAGADGVVRVIGASAGAGVISLEDDAGGEFVAFSAPSAITTSYTLTMPVAAPGSLSFVQVDAAGTVTFTTGGAVSVPKIIDADSDTKVDVEEGADDDTIRFDVGASGPHGEVLTDLVTLDNSLIKIGGVAGSAADGHDLSLSAGDGTGEGAGNGGFVTITAGTPQDNGTGGAVTITAGEAGGAMGNLPGDITIQTPDNGNAISSRTGNILIDAGNVVAGGSGDGGAITLDAGDARGTSGSGGAIAITAGAGSSTANGRGGDVTITSGDVGTGGAGNGSGLDAGNIFLNAGAATGVASSFGGNIELNSGAGGSADGSGGSVDINAGQGQTPGNVTIDAGRARSNGVSGGAVTITSGPTDGGAAGSTFGGDISLITSGSSNGSASGGSINLTTSAGLGGGGESGDADGGNILITTGAAGADQGDGGNVTFTLGNGASAATVPGSNGGAFSLTTGNGGPAGGVGGNISMTAGNGNVGVGGDVTITAGDVATGSANGGSITLTAGVANGAFSDLSGAIVLNGGSGATGNGVGGIIDINAGDGGTTGGGGGAISIDAGDGGGGATGGVGGAITIDAGDATGTGNLTGGAVTISTGTSVGSVAGPTLTLNAGTSTGSGDGGAIDINAGAGNGTGTEVGGAVTIDAGKGADTGNGGPITITAGDGGSTSGDGADLTLNAGDADGSGSGGLVNINAGTGASPGGSINLTAGASTSTDIGGAINLTAGAGGTGAGGDGGALVFTGGAAGAASAGDGGDIELRPGAADGAGTDGVVRVIGPTAGAGVVQLEDDAGGEFVAISAPSAVTSSYTLTMPAADAVGALTSDGAGTLSFSTAIAGGSLVDADGDTQIQIEEAADEDIIRFDTGDSPAGYSAQTDIMTLASSGWTVSLGTADAATTGAAISLAAGAGGAGATGGDATLAAGVSLTGSGGSLQLNGGTSLITGGGGTANLSGGNSADSIGGAVNISGGEGTTGGDISITSGEGISNGTSGDVTIGTAASAGTDTTGAITMSTGTALDGVSGGISITTGDSAGTGNDAGDIEVTAGAGNPGGETSGQGGDVTVTAGASDGSDIGGLITLTAGKGGSTGAGGPITLNAGDGGSTSGDGADIDLNAGDADGSGSGGDVNLNAGTGASPGGSINLMAGASTSTDVGGGVTITAGAGGTGAGGDGGAVVITAGSAGAASAGDGGDIELRPGALDGAGADGVVRVIGASAGAGEMRLEDDAGGEFVALKAASVIPSSLTLTLPTALPGVTGAAMVSDTSGNLSFSSTVAGTVTKFAQDNTTTSTTEVFNHALGSEDVIVQVQDLTVSPQEVMVADIEITDSNNVTITLAVAPAGAGEYRVIVMS